MQICAFIAVFSIELSVHLYSVDVPARTFIELFHLFALRDGSEAAAPESADFDSLPADCAEEENNPYDDERSVDLFTAKEKPAHSLKFATNPHETDFS